MKQKIGHIILSWLRLWAKLQLKKYAPDIIGITGSAGKSSCKNAVAAILNHKYALKVTGAANSESGIPLDILNIHPTDFSIIDWVRMCALAPINWLTQWQAYSKYIVEMGIDSPNPPKNMSYLLTIVKPRTAIFLNASAVHSQQFDHLGKDVILNIATEKGKLIESLPPNGLAILNTDQPEVAAFATRTKAKVVTFGTHPHADMRITGVKRDGNGTSFSFLHNQETGTVTIGSFLPDYYGHTLAAALCVNADEGNTLSEGCSLLSKNFTTPPGRMTIFRGLNHSVIIDSTYNASAESTIGALQMLARLPAKRKFAVLGPMNELGAETNTETNRVKEVAEKICHKVWYSTGKNHVEEIKQILQPGDYILIKGSQNRVFLELTVEALLANPTDTARLCRRGSFWDKQRESMLQ